MLGLGVNIVIVLRTKGTACVSGRSRTGGGGRGVAQQFEGWQPRPVKILAGYGVLRGGPDWLSFFFFGKTELMQKT